MKITNPLSLAAISLVVISSAHAATVTWVGDTDNVFSNPLNWPSDTLPSTSADTWQINGPGSQGSSTLTGGSVTFGGTAGKISFGASSTNMTLSGGTIALFQGTGDGILTAVTAGNTTTIGSEVIIGNGSAATNSISASGTGLLKVTGNITAGTGGTPGAVVLSLGSTDAQNGNYELNGNINKGATATTLQLTKRGTGTATLTGTNVFVNLGNNVGGSTIRINGGQTNILNAAGGGYGVANQATSVIRVSAGELNAFDSRNVRNSILVDGGTFNLGQAYNESGVLQSNNGTVQARLSFNGGAGAPAYTFTINSGNVTFSPAGGSQNFGVRLGNDSGANNTGTEATEATVAATQSGGTFIVNGRGSQDTTFSLGTATANKTNSYALSGGVLDVRGSDSTNGAISLGANATSGSAVFTLSGTGKLISRSNPGVANSGIAGRQAGAAQVLDLQGGTLVAGRIEAANIRGSLLGTNGNIVNNGSTIAPGDIGIAGRTNIQGGNLTLTSGTMLLDVFGTTAATSFQDATPGLFDNVLVSGILNYGGTLSLNFGAFTPTVGNTFDLFNFGSQTGTFSSIVYSDPGISGTLDYTTGVLTIDAIPEPSTWALIGAGLGGLLLLRRRQRKA